MQGKGDRDIVKQNPLKEQPTPAGLGKILVAHLIPDAKNPRKDLKKGDPEFEKISKSVEKFGQLDPIIFNTRTRKVIGGHQRLKVLDSQGFTELYTVTLGAYTWAFAEADLKELTDKEESAANIALNKAQGDWQMDQLTANLQELKLDGLLDVTGFDDKEFDAMIRELHKDDELQDSEPQISRAEELRKEWGTELGQMWQCGDHRVLCGDCTELTNVNKLMGGEKARLVFTSPPYNNSTGGYKSDYYGKKESFYQDKKSDHKTKEEWLAFCDSVLINCSKVVSDDHAIAWNVMYNADMRDAYGLSMFCGKHPFTVKETICWDKTRGFNIATKGILSRTWEFVFILSMGDRYFTTQKENEVRYALWKVNTNDTQISGVHNAAFPVGLPKQAIEWFSLESDQVYDPFLGSGTTMIACENLGRKARGIEIDPGYVAVCLERYKTTFNKQPVLLEGD